MERIIHTRPVGLYKKGFLPRENIHFFDKFKIHWIYSALQPVRCHYKTPMNSVGVYMKLNKYQIKKEPKPINALTFEAVKDHPDKLFIGFYYEYSGKIFNKRENHTHELLEEKVSDITRYPFDIEEKLEIVISPKFKKLITGVDYDKQPS